MSILNINKTNETNPNMQINDNRKPYNFATSSIIQGTITAKSNGITTVSIQSDNKNANPTILKLNSNEIFGEKDDTVAFEVVSNSKEALTLRQVLDKSKQDRLAQDSQEQANVLELYKKNNIIKDDDTKEARQEEQQLKQALIELQRDIRFGKSVNTTNAINTLISSGLNVDQVPLQTLTKAMSVPTNTTQATTDEQLNANEKLILQQLELTNLSQDKSLERINSLLDSVQSVLQSDQLDIVSILQSEQPITPSLLFANTTQQPKQLDTTNLDDTLRQDIANFLSKINVQPTEENIRLSQIFVKNDIAITEANISNYQFLTNPTIDVTTFAQLSIQSLLNNDNLMELQLTDNTPIAYTNYNEVVNSLKDVSDYTYTQVDIDNATIQSILKANANLSKVADQQQYTLTQQQTTAKNTLAEIILKLTSEVMYNLNSKGINITTEHLKDALQSVNTAQQQINEQVLASSNAQLDDEQQQLLHQTISQSRTASLLNPTLLTATDTQPTLVSLLQATNKYNDNATTISVKHNDSIYKVTDQIPALLESLGVTPTKSYIKSAQTLIRNNIDVTKENLDNVSTTIAKLELIQDKLQPSTVIKMLQDGINPLTTPIDELIGYINTYGDEYATNNGDNLAKYILQAQQDKDVSEDTTKAIKAIYRALNIIDKNGVASVGMSLKNNYNLTLNNLLDSAKIYTKTKNNNTYVNETITDTTNLKTANENSIKNLINNATLTTQAVNIQKFIDNANYTALKQLMEEDANIYDEVLEVLNDRLESINSSTQQQQQQVQQLQTAVSQLLETSPEVFSFLVANNLPITRNNIVSAQAFEDDRNAVTKIIDSLITNDYEDADDADNSLQEALSTMPTIEETNIFDNTNSQTLAEILSTTPVDINKLNLQQDALKILQLQNNLALNNNDYSSTPIQLSNGEITDITMHIITDDLESKTNLNLIFSLTTKNLGDINIAVNYDTTQDKVAVAIANDTDKLTNTQSLLQSIATVLNIEPSNISITTSNITTA